MNKKLIIASALTTLLTLPMVGLAQLTGTVQLPTALPGSGFTIEAVVKAVVSIIFILVAAATVIMFLIAGFLFITSQGDPTKTATARQTVIFGVIGFVVALVSLSIPVIIGKFLP